MTVHGAGRNDILALEKLQKEVTMNHKSFLESTQLARTARMEQRAAVRYSGNPDTCCQLLNAAASEWRPAWVRDISATGINVLLEQRFEPGTRLVIELENNLTRQLSRLEVIVIHSIECPNGDWFHGGAFSRDLTEQELRAFVQHFSKRMGRYG